MPMHDWTRVEDGAYHDFHGEWLYALKYALNDGLLPAGYYAAADQRLTGGLSVGPDLLTLRPPDATQPDGPATAVAEPAAHATQAVKTRPFAVGQRRVTVRHVTGDTVVAVVELVSPGNKGAERDFRRFVRKLVGVIEQPLHLVVIDPFPPTPRDPAGVHAALWKRVRAKAPGFRLPPGRPLCGSSYRSDRERVKAYLQPFAVGEVVPPLPLFLRADRYVSLPLEETYQAAFARVPARWRDRLTA